MKIKTGFYKLTPLTEEELKQFFIDSIHLSYNVCVNELSSLRREMCKTKSIQDMIDIVSKKNHNVCIDRTVQYKDSNEYEIGFSTLTIPIDYFLFCYLSKENFFKIVEKYKLKE